MAEESNKIPTASQCIIEVQTSSWYKMIELKMAYNKYHGREPRCDNVLEFYPLDIQSVDHDQQWQNFYDNVKDPSWPDCPTFGHVDQLPIAIQEEIRLYYQAPTNSVTNDNWINLLTIAYYDQLKSCVNHRSHHGGAVFLLDDYFANNLDVCKNAVQQVFGWTWNDEKSNKFWCQAMQANHAYIEWFDRMRTIVESTICGTYMTLDLQEWEKSLVLAQICMQSNIDPKFLPWDNISKLTDNQILVSILRNKHAKTF
jgi:hypothetical protein